VRTSVIRSSVGRLNITSSPALLILAWRCSGPAELRHEPMTLEKMVRTFEATMQHGWDQPFKRSQLGSGRIEGFASKAIESLGPSWVQSALVPAAFCRHNAVSY